MSKTVLRDLESYEVLDKTHLASVAGGARKLKSGAVAPNSAVGPNSLYGDDGDYTEGDTLSIFQYPSYTFSI